MVAVSHPNMPHQGERSNAYDGFVIDLVLLFVLIVDDDDDADYDDESDENETGNKMNVLLINTIKMTQQKQLDISYQSST